MSLNAAAATATTDNADNPNTQPTMESNLLQPKAPLNRKLIFDDSPGIPTKPGLSLSKLLLTRDSRGQSDSYLSNPIYRKPFYDSEDDDETCFPRLPQLSTRDSERSMSAFPPIIKLNLVNNFKENESLTIEEESVGTATSLDSECETPQDKDGQSSPMFQLRTRSKTHHIKKIGPKNSTKTTLGLTDNGTYDQEHGKENSVQTLDSSVEKTPSEDYRLLLPTCKNIRDPDLNTITSQTLIDLMNNPKKLNFLIIDCRYDYEFDGGHIKGAVNIVSPELLGKVFFAHRNLVYNGSVLEEMKKDLKAVVSNPRNYNPFDSTLCTSTPPILIFHCEFSQKRGPRAFRFLRNLDRQCNIDRWPNLYYPQIYVLDGGYRQFYAEFPTYCDPDGYVEMVASTCKKDYARAKDKEQKAWRKKYSIDILPSLIDGLQISDKIEKNEKNEKTDKDSKAEF